MHPFFFGEIASEGKPIEQLSAISNYSVPAA
jgi:hypothetical protein